MFQCVDQNDDPPFNFQQMLRKTEHRRASMKRTKGDASENGPTSSGYSSEQIRPRRFANEHNTTLDAKKDFNHNDGSPVDQVRPLPRARVSASNDNQIQFNRNVNSSSSFEDLGAVYTHEEIHPGVVLEGYAVDI